MGVPFSRRPVAGLGLKAVALVKQASDKSIDVTNVQAREECELCPVSSLAAIVVTAGRWIRLSRPGNTVVSCLDVDRHDKALLRAHVDRSDVGLKAGGPQELRRGLRRQRHVISRLNEAKGGIHQRAPRRREDLSGVAVVGVSAFCTADFRISRSINAC